MNYLTHYKLILKKSMGVIKIIIKKIYQIVDFSDIYCYNNTLVETLSTTFNLRRRYENSW